MSAAAGMWTCLTVGLIAAAGWAWWASGRVNDAAANALAAAEHAMTAAQDAHRCVTILRDWWSEAVIVDPCPPTVPEHRALGRIDDVELARTLAELDDQVRTWRAKPMPHRRDAV